MYTPVSPGKTVVQLLAAGAIDVAQSAVSASWGALEQGQTPATMHFAQINERDGFFIASRRPETTFSWQQLRASHFMFVHGGQPQAMLSYALHKQGVDVDACNATPKSLIDTWAFFASGSAFYVHKAMIAPYISSGGESRHRHYIPLTTPGLGRECQAFSQAPGQKEN